MKAKTKAKIVPPRRHLTISWDEGKANGMVDLRLEVPKCQDVSELVKQGKKDKDVLVTFTKGSSLGPLRSGFDLLSLRFPLKETYIGSLAQIMAGAFEGRKPTRVGKRSKISNPKRVVSRKSVK